MSFAEKLIAAVKTAEDGIDIELGKPFREVLEQFAATLRELGIGARLDRLGDPRKLGVWLYPEHRPSRGSLMLTFFFDVDAVVAFGESPTRLTTPDLLEAWLVEFVKKPAFIESLGILREEAKQPVEARLYVNADRQRHEQDPTVDVSARDQKALDGLPSGGRTSIDVVRTAFPGNPQITSQAYALLDSAGVVVRVEKSILDGAKLTIHVIR